MAQLEIDTVVKRYANGFTALTGVSFSASPGEFVVLVGPSGCGKSTLLRSIAGLETITSGRVAVAGRDVTGADPSDRGVAMVFQNYALYPHMTVAQNMGFALKVARRPRAEIDAAVNRAASILRITEHLAKRPKELSGGQKQRVAIGRAITRAPEIFLFDEPLSNLDAALRSQMRIELGRLHSELKATMVYVTHDQTEAMTMADRIVVMNAGRIEQIGAPLALYNRPETRFVAGFLGAPRMNFLPARVQALAGRTVTLAIDGRDAPLSLELDCEAPVPRTGDRVMLGLRPEGFALEGPDPEAARPLQDPVDLGPARIAVVEQLGRETLLYADAGSLRTEDSESQDGYLALHQPLQLDRGLGETLSLRVERSRFFLFAEDGSTLRFGRPAGC